MKGGIPLELEIAIEKLKKRSEGFDINYPEYPPPIIREYIAETECAHEWKAIQGLNQTWFNCKKCDMKKEEYDKRRNK